MRTVLFLAVAVFSFFIDASVGLAKLLPEEIINSRLPEFFQEIVEEHRLQEQNIVFLILHPQTKIKNYYNSYKFVAGLAHDNGILHSVLSKETFALGHTQLAWQCQIDGEKVSGATGQSGERDDQAFKMIDAGWGMTGAFSYFTDGFLQSIKSVDGTIKKSLDENASMAYVGVRVSAAQCESMLSFIREYIDKGAYKFFGTTLDPAAFEGGGCSSFAVRALEHGDILAELTSHYPSSVKIPNAFFGLGAPIELKNVVIPMNIPAGKRFISKSDFVDIRNYSVLFPEEDGSTTFNFFDTEIIYYSIVSLINALRVNFPLYGFLRPEIPKRQFWYYLPRTFSNLLPEVNYEDKSLLYRERFDYVDELFDDSFYRVSRGLKELVDGQKERPLFISQKGAHGVIIGTQME